MKKTIVLFASVLLSAFVFVQYASAHERDIYKIGTKEYQFVVGSLGEPVVVDDKSGVDFRITEMGVDSPGMMDMSNDDAVTGTPFTGVEKTLKVEIGAGNNKKTFDLEPAWNQPGAYHAVFFPTVVTTYTYRFIGTLNGIKVDIPFTCVAGEVSESSEDATVVKLTEGVTREKKVGGFGCPKSKADYGFPEALLSNYELGQKTQTLDANLQNVSASSRPLGTAGIGLGTIGIVLGIVAIVKNRNVI